MVDAVYVVILENDREIYNSDAYLTYESAKEQLDLVRSEWIKQYGADSFDELEQNDETVIVLDGPWAQLRRVRVNGVNEELGLIPNLGQP